MEIFTTDLPARRAAIHTLAAVGFVALVGASMWLAVYSTRFVPAVVGRIGSAAVYLGSVFTPSSKAPLSTIVPATSSTTTSSDTPTTAQNPLKPVPKTPGEKTSNTYQIGGTNPSPTLSGLPDLIVTIDAVGYLAAASADSFVATSTVPAGGRAAVKFTIKNIGTNVTGPWRFSASIPTQTAYIYQSQPQQSLNPGDSIDYTLGFDQSNKGSGQTISVTANFDRAAPESNFDNDSASTQITVLGS